MSRFKSSQPQRQRQKEFLFGDVSAMLTFVIVASLLVYLLFSFSRILQSVDISGVQVFNTIFISILMQAFPFMLIGVLVSSIMHIFVPDEWIVKIFPTRLGIGFFTAMFAGLFFPVCECAIVPVMSRLVKKGVAPPIAVTFMLSAPIINPIVIISTLYAFHGKPQVALLRVVFGLSIALVVGLVLWLVEAKDVLLAHDPHTHTHDCGCGGHAEHSCACDDEADKTAVSPWQKLERVFLHAAEEFFGVGKYLIIGAFITSLIQVLLPRSAFVRLGQQSGLALFVMMSAAFLFSACSTSDAFIAKSFLGQFSMGAIMGFLVYGPMMDIKNLLMLLSGFKKRFVVTLILVVTATNFVMLYFLGFLL